MHPSIIIKIVLITGMVILAGCISPIITTSITSTGRRNQPAATPVLPEPTPRLVFQISGL